MDSEIKKQAAKAAKEEAKAAAKAAKDAEKAAAKAVKEAEIAAAKAVKQAEKEAAKAAKKAEIAAAKAAKAAEPKVKAEKKEKADPTPLEAEIAELRLKFASLQEQCMTLQAKMDVIRAAVAP
jgi:chromosome segregation ATPase